VAFIGTWFALSINTELGWGEKRKGYEADEIANGRKADSFIVHTRLSQGC
jgi:hypothetical protein